MTEKEKELIIIDEVAIPYTYNTLRHYNDHTWEILDANGIPLTTGSCDMSQTDFAKRIASRVHTKPTEPQKREP